jgi:hypothetical protein
MQAAVAALWMAIVVTLGLGPIVSDAAAAARGGHLRRRLDGWTYVNGTYVFVPPNSTLTLVNADTGNDVSVLWDQYLILADQIPHFSMRADFDPAFPTESVQFKVDNKVVKTEAKAPYALNGNSGPNYFPFQPFTPAGVTTFEAIAYSGEQAAGTVGPSIVVTVMLNGYPEM